MIKRQFSIHLNTNVYQKHGIQPPIQWTPAVRRSKCEDELSFPSPAEHKTDWSFHMHVYGVLLRHRDDVYTHLPSRPQYQTKNELRDRRI